MTTKPARLTAEQLDAVAAHNAAQQQENATERDRDEDRLLRALDAAHGELTSFAEKYPDVKQDVAADLAGITWAVYTGRQGLACSMTELKSAAEWSEQMQSLYPLTDAADEPGTPDTPTYATAG